MRRNREKGVALLLTAVFTICLIPVVGLAIDASYMYVVKAKLTAAADAAALAAARNLTVGLTMADQENAARSRAEAFFHANFPDGYMDTLSKSVNITVAETTSRIRTVHVNASTRAHTWFMGFLGFRHVDINTHSTASRRDVNLMLVLDRSGSMSGACTTMKNAAKQFIDGFANGRDRIGMVAFSTGYSMGYLPDRDFKTSSPTLASRIDQITCVGGTNSVQAMREGWEPIKAMNEPGALNVVVFFTDGQPTALPAVFPVKMATDTRFGYSGGPTGCTSTSTTCSMPPSTCRDSAGRSFGTVGWNPIPRRGIIVATGTNASTGATGAIISSAVQTLTSPHLNPINSAVTTSDEYASGCAFSGDIYRARRDVAYIPDTDIYGNNTKCCYVTTLSSDRFSAGAYSGYLRPDRPVTIEKAASNAVDNQANTIRSHSTLYPVIYSIGLASVDEVLLKRIANDPSSPSYNTSQQAGLYAYAPDQTQLARAFAVIQSEILRIAR